LAITPPTQAMSVLAGSGPSLRPYGASTRLTCPSTLPGRARTRVPSSSASIPRQCRRTSTSTLSVCACPLRLVPPARNTSGVPLLRA
jgi:hypothetical protein